MSTALPRLEVISIGTRSSLTCSIRGNNARRASLAEGLAETLANLSNIIRRRKEIRLKARALSAESKASATVLALLPFAVGALLFFLNPSLMSVLLDDPRGRFMMGMALLSLAIGVSVMAVIIRRSLR